MRKILTKLFLLFILCFGFGISAFAEEKKTEVFTIQFSLEDDETLVFYLFSDEEYEGAVFADTKKAEVNVVLCDHSEVEELKKIAFEAKSLVKSVTYRYEYEKEKIYEKITDSFYKFAPNVHEEYTSLDEFGYVKAKGYVTSYLIAMADGSSEQIVDASENSSSNVLVSIWSFTDEIQTMIEYYYEKDFPDKEFDYRLIPTGSFSAKLDDAFTRKSDEPDLFTLEDSFIRRYVENGADCLLDLTDLYNEIKNKMVDFPAKVGTYNGKVYALAWNMCPGAMFYRRSLAKKYLGTDDPDLIQKRVATWDDFLSTAETLKRNSNGKCVIVASYEDLFKPFEGARKQSWVVKKKLFIDPAMEQYMEMCRTLRERDLEGHKSQWSDEWFDGVKDEMKDENGNDMEVFSYFLPGWGLHYLLKPCSEEKTNGDWAMVPGPSSFRWGGTWLAINKNAKNPEEAKQFVKYIVSDDSFQQKWAEDTGDMGPDRNGLNEIKGNFSEPFLGGQNHYEVFAAIAENVTGGLEHSADSDFEKLWKECCSSYAKGEISKAEAIKQFRQNVKTQLGY
ncbi:MAG: extracellular solute-binding protein [Treponema sp.]|uniref:ABC transporter substrate-binding protein n=1 Tax=Treponema sp. TaxID=166 RepID=UPI00298DE1A4|nr:extracellular solute-binding protein [Treponema sp.]MCR5386148.1 extracellular solute-binding protein [Treponema sp.]